MFEVLVRELLYAFFLILDPHTVLLDQWLEEGDGELELGGAREGGSMIYLRISFYSP